MILKFEVYPAELAWSIKNSVDGNKYYCKNATFQSLVDWLACDAPVRLSWPVKAIRWQGEEGGVEVVGPRDEVRLSLACMYALIPAFITTHKKKLGRRPLLEF